MLIETYSEDRVLVTVRLERDESGDISDEETLAEQLGAMGTFAEGWLEPLALSAWIQCCDPRQGYSAFGVAQPNTPVWFLRARDLPPRVDAKPIVVGSQVEELGALTSETIAASVRRALAQRCVEPGSVIRVEKIEWTATRARVCQRVDGTEAVVVDDRRGRFTEVPIEWRAEVGWASGPRADGITGAPVRLSVSDGELRCEVIWDLWTRAPGSAEVHAAVQRVLALGSGWTLAE